MNDKFTNLIIQITLQSIFFYNYSGKYVCMRNIFDNINERPIKYFFIFPMKPLAPVSNTSSSKLQVFKVALSDFEEPIDNLASDQNS